MPIQPTTTAIADAQAADRVQEFETALARYLEGYRQAGRDRRRTTADKGGPSLIGLFALITKAPAGSRA